MSVGASPHHLVAMTKQPRNLVEAIFCLRCGSGLESPVLQLAMAWACSGRHQTREAGFRPASRVFCFLGQALAFACIQVNGFSAFRCVTYANLAHGLLSGEIGAWILRCSPPPHNPPHGRLFAETFGLGAWRGRWAGSGACGWWAGWRCPHFSSTRLKK